LTIDSNYFTVNPVTKAERHVKDENTKALGQPNVVKVQNQGMGSVDVCFCRLASYRPRLLSQK